VFSSSINLTLWKVFVSINKLQKHSARSLTVSLYSQPICVAESATAIWQVWRSRRSDQHRQGLLYIFTHSRQRG